MRGDIDALIIVLLLAALVLILILARVRADRRASAWGQHVRDRLDVIDQKLQLLREDVERRDLRQSARINVVERRMAAYEAPEPMGALLDEEDENV